MTVLFSKKCEYALQSLLFLAEFQDEGILSADHIANHLDIPKEFVSKILRSLTKSGLVVSQRGKTGGFQLAHAPERISLMDVIADIDGTAVFEDCLFCHPSCNPDAPCPVHETWSLMQNQLSHLMKNTHLDNFIPGQSLHQFQQDVNA